MAFNAVCASDIIVPIMDARRGQVYNAIYRADGKTLHEIVMPRAIEIEKCCDDVEKLAERAIFLGDGLPVHREYIANRLGDKAIFAPASINAQMAGSAAVLAAKKPQISYAELVPFYLRKSQAEREYEEKQRGR
jgi:tRNA threonylcarbamoyladenosine biosynthesis protein TsaB